MSWLDPILISYDAVKLVYQFCGTKARRFRLSAPAYSDLLSRMIGGDAPNGKRRFSHCVMISPYSPRKWFKLALGSDKSFRDDFRKYIKDQDTTFDGIKMPRHHLALAVASQPGGMEIKRYLIYSTAKLRFIVNDKHERRALQLFLRCLSDGNVPYNSAMYKVFIYRSNRPDLHRDLQVFDRMFEVSWNRFDGICKLALVTSTNSCGIMEELDIADTRQVIEVGGRDWEDVLADIQRLCR